MLKRRRVNENVLFNRTLIVYKRDRDNRWYWELVGADGLPVANSRASGYAEKDDAVRIGESITGRTAIIRNARLHVR